MRRGFKRLEPNGSEIARQKPNLTIGRFGCTCLRHVAGATRIASARCHSQIHGHWRDVTVINQHVRCGLVQIGVGRGLGWRHDTQWPHQGSHAHEERQQSPRQGVPDDCGQHGYLLTRELQFEKRNLLPCSFWPISMKYVRVSRGSCACFVQFRISRLIHRTARCAVALERRILERSLPCCNLPPASSKEHSGKWVKLSSVDVERSCDIIRLLL